MADYAFANPPLPWRARHAMQQNPGLASLHPVSLIFRCRKARTRSASL